MSLKIVDLPDQIVILDLIVTEPARIPFSTAIRLELYFSLIVLAAVYASISILFFVNTWLKTLL